MRVCVVGGAGKMALGAIRDLLEHDAVEEVVLVDREAGALAERHRRLDSAKLRTVACEIADGAALVAALSGCDACLNATLPYFNEAVMEACLEAGVHYTDMGGLFHWARKQVAMSERFAEAGLTAVCGSGSAPGIVNVMARYAALRLDTVEWVRIRDGIADFAPPPAPLAPPYSLDTLLNEFIMEPWVFLDGEWLAVPPFSGAEVVDFPEPVGPRTCFCTIHSEPCTIPVSFRDKGIRECSFKLSLPEAFEQKLRFVAELGLADKDAVDVDGAPVVPRALLLTLVERTLAEAKALAAAAPAAAPAPDDHKVLRVDVRGTKDGQVQDYRLESVLHPYPEWDMACGPFTVGFPAAVTARLLAAGAVERRGAFGGEACIPPEQYFAELNRRGIHVSVSRSAVY